MDKIRTSMASRRLAIHPAHFLLHVAELDMSLSFEDVWPDIDEAWIQTVSASGRYKQIQTVGDGIPLLEPVPRVCASGLSDAAVLVLDKLFRQHKWGSVSVSFDALVKMTHLSSSDLQEAIAELRRRNLIIHEGTGRKISLDSARSKEIETITKQRVAVDVDKGRR